jgi:hypothetical protein
MHVVVVDGSGTGAQEEISWTTSVDLAVKDPKEAPQIQLEDVFRRIWPTVGGGVRPGVRGPCGVPPHD